MSAAATAWAWQQQQPDLGHTNKFVLLALADEADNEGRTALQREIIERRTMLSETTVRRAAQELVQAGLMEKVDDVVRRDPQSGQNTLVPLYRLRIAGQGTSA